MKGLIFSHLLTFVEKEYGDGSKTKMLESAGRLSADGSYIESESYPYEEIFHLAGNLSTITNVSMAKTFENFGEYLFIQLAKAFSQFFSPDETLFGFLQKLEDHIHMEVRKKYPGAKLPGGNGRGCLCIPHVRPQVVVRTVSQSYRRWLATIRRTTGDRKAMQE